MTVAELIEALRALDQEAIVVMQKDAEGNGYSPAYGAENAWYAADSTWSGEVYRTRNEAREAGGKRVRCVVLWPVN